MVKELEEREYKLTFPSPYIAHKAFFAFCDTRNVAPGHMDYYKSSIPAISVFGVTAEKKMLALTKRLGGKAERTL